MRITQLALVCVVAVLPLGCASWAPGSINGSAANTATVTALSQTQSLIAGDFVNALRQIRDMPPASTTVHLLRESRTDEFTRAMQSALEIAGYGIRWVDDNSSGNLLQYRQQREAGNERAHRDLFEVAIGFVEMRRSYTIDSVSGTQPVTPLYVRGTDASNVVLNDDAFNTVPGNTQKALYPPVESSGQSADVQIAALPDRPAIVPQNTIRSPAASRLPALPPEANPLSSLIPNAERANGLTMPLIALPQVQNVFELGGSNFETILAEHHVVDEQVLTFANDSLRLGELNKQFVEKMVEDFNGKTDIFSIIGCSLGPTQVAGGNAALALGRANRVREALLFAGVPENLILDEGCWAGDTDLNTLPRRGVVVTLNRKNRRT